MSRISRRSIFAVVLISAAVVLPCTAWYLAGSRAAASRADRLMEEPVERARGEAGRLAAQIARRLEDLRQAETRRPFSDYMTDDELLRTGCSYEARILSPLAQGPADPLIDAHFQLDELGRLTLPSLGNDAARADPRQVAAAAIQQAIFEELECANSEHLAALRRGSRSRQVASATGIVAVGTLTWHTVELDGDPALVAMREVSTPSAVLTQGFVVSRRALSELLGETAFPVSLRPGAPTPATRTESVVPLEGDAWTVAADATRELTRKAGEARSVRRRFQMGFAIGGTAAAIAGLLVILLILQTERLAEQRAQFAAAAAHELRTPLAGMQLLGEMLANGAGSVEQRAGYAGRIAGEAQRLGRVVGNVLGLTRLERGGLAGTAIADDLAEAVERSVEQLRPHLESHGAGVQVERPEGPVAALIDRDAVHQILQNLLDNGEKYSRGLTERTLRVVVEDGAQPTLTVSDRGPGLPASMRRRLFRPFSRGGAPDDPAGLGIGLALVKELCQAQGARVEHRVPDGGGAAFRIVFRQIHDDA